MALTKISSEVIELLVDNYVTSVPSLGTAVSDLGWTTYADAAGVNPVDGLGGTPGVTLSLNGSSPLSGTADYRLVKDASNRQGNGFGYNFTVANRHLGKVLQVVFDAELISGNYENPITTPITGTYSITSTTCTVTAPHSFVQGQYVFMTFTSGTRPADGFYTITSVTATTFVFTVSSGSSTGNCSYTAIGDLRVSIIQDPTGTPVIIEPVNTNLQLGVANQRIRHIASFQTHISITSYRLCIHVGSASTVAYTVDFANFKVWEPTQSIGAVITDWQSYTPTSIQGFPSINNSDFIYRRVSGNMEIRARWNVISNDSNQIRVPLPFGSIDSTRVPNLRIVGMGAAAASFTVLASPSDTFLNIGVTASTPSTISIGTNWSVGQVFGFYASVPIQGWGSSVAMSSDSGDGRLVAFSAGTLTQSNVANATFKYSTINYDTHGAWNSTTGLYTVPISGVYNINLQYTYQSGDSVWRSVSIYINGTSYRSLFDANTSVGNSGGTDVYCNAGQTISVAFTSSGGGNAISGGITIKRISAGSQIIASVEGVNLLYTTASNTHNSSSNYLDLVFGTRVKDSHGSYNITTGVFTAPMSGCYDIEAQCVFVTNITGGRIIGITDTSNTFIALQSGMLANNTFGGAEGMSNVSLKSYPMLAGQQIKIRYFQNSGGSLNLTANQTNNRLSITRSGNY